MKRWMEALAKARPGDSSATQLVHGWLADPARQPSVLYNGMIAPLLPFANKAGLPASPFRTDDWPEMSRKKIKKLEEDHDQPSPVP